MEGKTRPGEKGFAFVLLGFGVLVLAEAVKMYQKDPKVSSYGAMPVFLGCLLILFSLIIIIQNTKKKSEMSGQSFKTQLSIGWRHLFQIDVAVMILLLLAYSVALFLGLGFVIATPIFLWVSMSYLTRKKYAMNLVYTAIVMAFIMLVFKVVFRVVLP